MVWGRDAEVSYFHKASCFQVVKKRPWQNKGNFDLVNEYFTLAEREQSRGNQPLAVFGFVLAGV